MGEQVAEKWHTAYPTPTTYEMQILTSP
uniref:Uncharacterized protein n=1 Tax=Rhizophora mucronata TaxID=61149 RepID=A0A2P2PJ32_RHIMU